MKSSEERVGESEFAIDGDLDGVLDTVTELVKEEVKIVQDRWRGEIGQGVIGIGQCIEIAKWKVTFTFAALSFI